MTTDPDQIRSEISALLAVLPDPDSPDFDTEEVATRLEEAHDLLVRALESVEKAPAARSEVTGGHAQPGGGVEIPGFDG